MAIEMLCEYSTISSKDLMQKVLPDYCIDQPLKCLFWERGANDNYQVVTADKRYSLRIYRHGINSRDEIDFEVAAAANSPALLSLCTEYTKSGDSFDINYDSCAVKTPLVNGSYNSSMEITNNINSVVGVVWFKDEAIPPVYKEFSLEVGAKLARRGAGPQAIVWR